MAVEELEEDFAPLDVVLIESGGDNLTATFSPALVDTQIFVLDVAGGGDVARKGGPGIERADLLVVNKTDLAPYVGVDRDQMVVDAARRPRRSPGDRAVAAPTRSRSRRWSPGCAASWLGTGPATSCRSTPVRWRRTATRHVHAP